MKTLYCILMFMFFATISNAETLCGEERNIVPEFPAPESRYNEENAKKALTDLSKIVSGELRNEHWTILPNSLNIIEGYALKKRALERTGTEKERALSAFCEFMKNESMILD